MDRRVASLPAMTRAAAPGDARETTRLSDHFRLDAAASAPTDLPPHAMAPHRAAWADLAMRALEANIFNDPAFLMPAALHLSQGRRPRFLLAWDPNDPSRLIGLCCMAAATPGLLRSAWLHPQATAAFPLLDASEPAEAFTLLLAQTGRLLRPAGLLMHGLPAGGATMRFLETATRWSLAPVECRSRAVARGTPKPVSGKAGKEFRRQERRLVDLGKVALTIDATPAALDTFLQLERGGWKGRRGSALADTPGLARFAREMVGTLAGEGRCRIHSLTLDGRPIAMGLVLRSGPHAFFWKTAFDENYARFSPGSHLAEAVARFQAGEPGVALTDSCAVPRHSMIDRVWPDRMTVNDLFAVPAREWSARHRALLAFERGRRAARAWAKQALSTLRQQRMAARPHF